MSLVSYVCHESCLCVAIEGVYRTCIEVMSLICHESCLLYVMSHVSFVAIEHDCRMIF